MPKNPRREKVRVGNLEKNQASSSKTFLRAAPKINKKIKTTKEGCFRSRDEVHAVFIRSLLYSRYGKDKTREELYLYHTEKDSYLAKENTTYVRYKRPIAKKLI